MDPPTTGSPPRMPPWVKVFVIAGVALLALIIVVLAFGGGQHGPGRHLGGEGNGDPQPLGDERASTDRALIAAGDAHHAGRVEPTHP